MLKSGLRRSILYRLWFDRSGAIGLELRLPFQVSSHRVLVLVLAAVAVLVSLAVPVPAAATAGSVGAPQETMPPIMGQPLLSTTRRAPLHLTPFQRPIPLQRAGAAGAQALTAQPFRQVFGFVNAGNLDTGSGVGYNTWDFRDLTTVAFFGVHINYDGSYVTNDSTYAVWNSGVTTALVNTAHANGVKVVLSIILQDSLNGTPAMCAGLSPLSALHTAQQTAQELAFHGVDGVNIDYESYNTTCANTGRTSESEMTDFAKTLRATLPAGMDISIDTYASSAAYPGGFYDVPGLSPYVNSFFVMAYDLEYSNWSGPPTNCAAFCLGPTSPLTGYTYNQSNTADQYIAAVGPGKVIMGVPYYGRKGCVNSLTQPNQIVNGPVGADTYLDNVAVPSTPGVSSFAAHRDGNDPAGAERWDTFYSSNYSCNRQLYWDDVTSLGRKYDMINAKNLLGVGIFTLDYGGGAPELWDTLAQRFACRVPAVGATSSANSAYVWWATSSTPRCNPVATYTVTASPGGASTTVYGSYTSATVSGLTPGTAYTFTVTASGGPFQYQTSPPSFPITPAGAPTNVFTALPSPVRVCDSRPGNATPCSGHQPGPGGVLNVSVAGAYGIPASATAMVANVTAVGPDSSSYLTVFPAGAGRPPTSSLNFPAGTNVPNLVTSSIGSGGMISVYNNVGNVDVVVDVQGYFGPPSPVATGAGHLVPITPVRVVDTRYLPTRVTSSPLTVPVTGTHGIPADAAAVIVNATVVSPSQNSFLTVYPAGIARPGTSNLNFAVGQNIANRVMVPIGSGGQLSLFNANGSADVVLDVSGYYLPSTAASNSGSTFWPLTPVRIYDSRPPPYEVGPWAGRLGTSPISVSVANLGGVPAMGAPSAPTAVVLNVTAVDATTGSLLAVYPAEPYPQTSDLNFPPHVNLANMVVVPVGPDGTVRLLNSLGSVDAIFDVVGFYTAAP